MRILCENCGAKYQISDDKVRNKVFKIRCKKCSHVIVVRAHDDEEAADPALAQMPAADEQAALGMGAETASEGGEGYEQDERTHVVNTNALGPGFEADAGPAPDAIWFVVIRRESCGPLTREQVEGYFAAGDLDGESIAWCEGMADWTKLSEIPEFSHLFPNEAAAPAAAAASDGMFGALDGDEDVMVSPSSVPEHEVQSPRVSSGHQLRNQRNENSVLFSLDALADETGSSRSSQPIEGSGLLDISAFAPADGGAHIDPFSTMGAGFAPVNVGGGAAPSLLTKKSGGGFKVVAMVLGGVVLIGGAVAGTMMFMRGNKEPADRPVVTTPNTAVPQQGQMVPGQMVPGQMVPGQMVPGQVVPGQMVPGQVVPGQMVPGQVQQPPAADPQNTADDDDDKNDNNPNKPPRPNKPNKPNKGSGAGSTKTTTSDTPSTPATNKPTTTNKPKGGSNEADAILSGLGGGSKPTTPATPPATNPVAPSSDPGLPSQLSKQQIVQVVKKGSPAIQQCRSGDASGTVTVKMTVAPSGSVSSAEVVTPEFKGTPVGNCVESKVRTFKFPAFSGSPMTFNMPFKL